MGQSRILWVSNQPTEIHYQISEYRKTENLLKSSKPVTVQIQQKTKKKQTLKSSGKWLKVDKKEIKIT